MIKKNFSRSEKINSHNNFTQFGFYVKTASERIVLPVKEKHSQKNSGTDLKRQNFTNETVISAQAITFCIKPLTHYLSRSALRIGET